MWFSENCERVFAVSSPSFPSVEPRGLDCMYRVVQPPPKWCDLSLLRNALGLSHVPPSAFPWAEVSCESLVELSLQSLISVQLVESDLHWPPVPQKGGLVIDRLVTWKSPGEGT